MLVEIQGVVVQERERFDVDDVTAMPEKIVHFFVCPNCAGVKVVGNMMGTMLRCNRCGGTGIVDDQQQDIILADGFNLSRKMREGGNEGEDVDTKAEKEAEKIDDEHISQGSSVWQVVQTPADRRKKTGASRRGGRPAVKRTRSSQRRTR